MAHGGSASAVFRLRRERGLERVRALLDLSGSSFSVMYISLLVLLLAGIITGFLGRWWGSGWIWTALILLLGTAVAMFFSATGALNKLRRAAGLPWMDAKGGHPAEPPLSEAQLGGLQDSLRPMLFAVFGLLPIALILWLMVFKPF
jgi:hypothetical protein